MLPRKVSANGLWLPAIHDTGKEVVIVDVHHVNKDLCYLRGAEGIPTPIKSLSFRDEWIEYIRLTKKYHENGHYLNQRDYITYAKYKRQFRVDGNKR